MPFPPRSLSNESQSCLMIACCAASCALAVETCSSCPPEITAPEKGTMYNRVTTMGTAMPAMPSTRVTGKDPIQTRRRISHLNSPEKYALSVRTDIKGYTPSNMANQFYFGGDSTSVTSNEDDADDTVQQEALPRSDFLAEKFDASEYLSTLADRHQTLEDLKEDLNERSQSLSKELLDLVNDNYEQFLSLGSDLRGGEEKVEDLRVGMLGLKRGFEEVKSQVTQRRQKVDELLDEKKDIAQQINAGRKMLELDARMEELEEKLMMASLDMTAQSDLYSGSEDEDDDGFEDVNPEDARVKELERLVKDYRQMGQLSSSVGQCAFVIAQAPRADRIRNTLLLDLATELKKAKGSEESSKTRMVQILALYREMGESAEAVKMLRDLKS